MSQGSPPKRDAYAAALGSPRVQDFKNADARNSDLDLTSSELLNTTVRLKPSVIVHLLSDERFCTDVSIEFVCQLERRGHLLATLEDLITEQITAASAATLFREDHISTKLLQVFLFTRKNSKFLSKTIAPLICAVIALKHPIELNPERISGVHDPQAAVAASRAAVAQLVSELLSSILENIDGLPRMFGTLIGITKRLAGESFEELRNGTLVESVFFFLRFICPAILSPAQYNVPVHCSESDISGPVRRGLVYVSKVVQAIGNATEFDGNKEKHMLCFNGLVKGHREKVQDIYRGLIRRGMSVAKTLEQSRKSSIVQEEEKMACTGYLRKRIAELDLQKKMMDISATLAPIQRGLHPALWNPEEVCIWLRSKELSDFVPTFRTHSVDGKTMLMLKDEELASTMGVVAKSQRSLLLGQIGELLESSKAFLPPKVDLSSPEATAEWLRRAGPRGVHRVVSQVGLPPYELIHLSLDELLVCGCPRKKLEDGIALLRNQRFWTDLSSVEQAMCLIGNDAAPTANVADTRLENWFRKLSGSREEEGEDSAVGSSSDTRISMRSQRRAFDAEEHYVSGKLEMKTQRQWKEHWILLDRAAKTLLVYPSKAAIADINPLSVRALGTAVKSFDIMNCSIQDGSGLTGKANTLSIWEKGTTIRHFLCPTDGVSECWRAELLQYSMIMHVNKLNLDMFGAAAAVASDDHGVIVGANRQALQLFGYNEAEVVGKNLKMLMPSSVGKHHDGFLSHYRKHQDRRLIGKARVLSIRCKDGREPQYTLRLGEYMEGKHLRFVGVFTKPTFAEEEYTLSLSEGSNTTSASESITCPPCPAYRPTAAYVTGLLDIRSGKSWKRRWAVLERGSKTLSVYPTKSKPTEVNSMSIRALGSPSKTFNVMDCSVRDGSGLTGKPGTFSICEKGDKIRHFLCPTNKVANAWLTELKAYAMITSVETLDVNAFDAAAVAATDQGIIVAANALAQKLFGYSEAEMVGENLRMLMPGSVAQHHDGFLDHYRKHHDRRLIGKARIVNIRCRDGSEPQYTIRLGEFMEGKNLRFVGVFTNEDPDTCAADLSEVTDRSDSGTPRVTGATCPVVHLKSPGTTSVSAASLHNSMVRGGREDLAAHVELALPNHASELERSAFNIQVESVSGFLKVKSTGRWKDEWVILDLNKKKLSLFSAKKGLKSPTPQTVRTLGSPSRVLNIVDSTVRDGSGITGKAGTFSICEKGDHVRHFLCPSASVARLWIEALKRFSMITALDKLDVDMFQSAAVAATDHGIIVSANRDALQLFGYSEAELIGQNLKILMPASIGKNHDTFLAHYRKYKDRRLIGKARVVSIRRKDGSEKDCTIHLGEYMEGKNLRFVGVFTEDDVDQVISNKSESESASKGSSMVGDSKADTWYSQLHSCHGDSAGVPHRKLSSLERRAFRSEADFVSGRVHMKLKRSWKEYWLVLNRAAQHLKVYPVKSAMRYVDLMALRALGPPLKLFHVVDCSIREGSGITGKAGTVSVCEKGDHARFFVCPTPLAARLWIDELLKYSMIISVDVLDVENFEDAAVASNDHGIIVDANKQALQLFGYSEAELIGQNLSMLMPASVSKHHDGFLAHYRKHRDRRLIGKARAVHIRCRDGGEPLCTIRLGEYMEGKNLRFVGVLTRGDTTAVDDTSTANDADTWHDYDSDGDPFTDDTSARR